MKEYASEAGHWYDKNGAPAYTIIGKNGKERPTTLRDARKLSLYPSVTTILKVIAKPGLELWKARQILESALTLPRIKNESLDDYAKRVITDSQEQANKAKEKGIEVHADLENYLRRRECKHFDSCQEAYDNLLFNCGPQVWSNERSFVHEYGYGGKVDLSSKEWVIDFKTKEFDETNLPNIYDEHAMQLAPYRRGLRLDGARCGILFVSTSKIMSHFVEISEVDLKRGLNMFDAALSFWQESKRYSAGKKLKIVRDSVKI